MKDYKKKLRLLLSILGWRVSSCSEVLRLVEAEVSQGERDREREMDSRRRERRKEEKEKLKKKRKRHMSSSLWGFFQSFQNSNLTSNVLKIPQWPNFKFLDFHFGPQIFIFFPQLSLQFQIYPRWKLPFYLLQFVRVHIFPSLKKFRSWNLECNISTNPTRRDASLLKMFPIHFGISCP